MSTDRPFLGIDIGGTTLAVGIATERARVLAHMRQPSHAYDGPEAMIGRVIEMARTAVTEAGLDMVDIAAIGIGSGGPLDPWRGIVHNALNNPGWINVPLVERIQSALGRPTYLDNDANAAALAEHRFGAGRGMRNLVYLTISTGVGGGVIVDDQLIRGENGNAAELGHISVRDNGRPCHCGSCGCLEAYCSGTSIAVRAGEALAQPGAASSLIGYKPLSAEHVTAAALDGDPLAGAIWQETLELLAAGIGSIINAFNPRLVLLGGGVTKAGDMLFEPLRPMVARRSMPWLGDAVEIAPAQLGDLVGVLGAVAVAVDRFEAAGDHDAPADPTAASPPPVSVNYPHEWQEHQQVVTDAAALLPLLDVLARRLCEAFDSNRKLITFGNGGSAAEAQHFASELLGRFRSARRSLPAISLTTDPSTLTGIANDFGFENVYARQVEALAEPGDVVIGMTTSGRSENVVRGLRAARALGAFAVAWTGADPGPAGAAAELVLSVPSTTTARIQEMHTLAMHTICVAIDARYAADPGAG